MSGRSAMDGRADSEGRVYQAAGDQQIIEHHHHSSSDWRVVDSSRIESVRRPTGGRAPAVFRDRTELTERLHTAVEPGNCGQIYVLHGMGGCGKTAVAHEVFRYATDVAKRIGLWVNASDPAALRGGMLAVAADRGAEEGELLAARNGLRAAADLVWDKLDGSEQSWLLVLDNADDPAVLQDGWLRSSPRGTVLVTTRQAAAHRWTDAELHHVGVLPPEAAAQVLCDLAPQTGTVEEARSVADRLGRLPLALTLAGGFLAHQFIDPWTMARYGEHLDGPEQVGFIDQGAVSLPGEDARGLLSRTWQLSLDALSAQGLPESTTLLRLLACYGAAPLPLSLLSGLDKAGLLPRGRAEAALRGLLDQSLVTLVDAGVRCAQAHGVLMASVAAGTSASAVPELAVAAARLLDKAVPAVPQRGPQNLQLRLFAPHALALLQRSNELSITADALDVALRLAIALHRTGDYLTAWELASASAAAAEPTLGAEHRLILGAYSRAGRALFRLGKFDAAETLLRRVLEDRERLFGTEDPDTLDSYYGLNLPLQQMGRASEGIPLLRHAISARSRVLGLRHPLTLRARAAILEYLHDSELAAEVDQMSVPLPLECATYLGEGHDETLGARHAYALALFRLRRLEAADEGARSVVDEYERRYGSDFPITFAAQTLYARTRASLGHFTTAIETMNDVVVKRERSLGTEHPHTINSRGYLAEFTAWAEESQSSAD
ncbi:tetratricopeptide repeat protein [Streptomyces albidus (ex Kaewkla and Franco 2022)]|uniref:tetratricopeptide repeat protein n=1 Tax=Streptomyces albidus (ex Kaewkla and Franco 2022) TaxID=722709 RepID=UPI0015EFDBF8|nr:tetratricopeptide repeat protein [Streptomyces albidus (ex Kaewkla and Franco 2022)]